MIKLAVVLTFGTAVCCAQEFEVASVKPNTSSDRMSMLGGPEMGRGVFKARNVTLRALTQFAYGVPDFLLIGGPAWMGSDRFDVDAKASGPMTVEQGRVMLRQVLEERFRLKVRRETATKPVYALVVAQKGSKLTLSEDQTPPVLAPPVEGAPRRDGLPRGAARIGPGQFHAFARPVESVTQLLIGQLGRPVLDRTGLKGLYDMDLKWSPDQIPPDLPPEARPDADGPSLFAALEEQLGLKLESTSAPVEVVVVERVEKPTAN